MSQELINLILGAICAVSGWFLKTMWYSIRELQKQLASVEILVAGDYVKREYLDTLAKIMFDKLDKISDKIDKKADK